MTTYTLQPAEADTLDCYMDNGNATTAYNTDVLTIGKAGIGANVYRTLIKFVLTTLPSGFVVQSAVMSLYINADLANTTGTWSAYRVMRAWTEAATWNTYDGSNAWGTAGCGNTTTDRESATIGLSATIGAAEAVGTEIQITLNPAYVMGWLTGAFTNNGMLIKSTTESADDAYAVDSSASATSAERPKLVITGRMRNVIGLIGA